MSGLSNTLMEHVASPRNQGPMENPDRIGLVGVPGNGPFMLLCLRIQENRVVQAKFQTYGCGASIAAGSLLTILITNRTLEECLALTVEQLTEALGGVPPNKLHCPALAIGALQNALRNNQH
jgi:nitrogen fixation protein NifU and related proteins